MTNDKLKEVLRELEVKNNVKVLYITKSGSKLYGTDNPNSDEDYKFIYASIERDVLLKRDKEFLKIGKDTKIKNGKDDVDLDGYSVHKFMDLLAKSETGAMDVLFSMFNPDNVIFEDPEFTALIKENYNKFLNRNMKSFIGYALGQTKKFGIKGARYDELTKFVSFLNSIPQSSPDEKLNVYFERFETFMKEEKLKYIKFVQASKTRGLAEEEYTEYISVLGKMFEGSTTFLYMKERVQTLFDQFGNRTKSQKNANEVLIEELSELKKLL